MWSRFVQHVIWVAVFQRNLLFVSSGGFLKTEVECFLRKVSILVCNVSVCIDTIQQYR